MFEPDPDRDPRSPSRLRVLIWAGVGAFAIYLIVTGLTGILGLNR